MLGEASPQDTRLPWITGRKRRYDVGAQRTPDSSAFVLGRALRISPRLRQQAPQGCP